MSTIILDYLQLGSSLTSNQNITLRTNKNGTFSGVRGDGVVVFDVTSDGVVKFTQNNKVGFSAYRNATQSITTSTFTVVQCDIEEFDANGLYNNTNATVNLSLIHI